MKQRIAIARALAFDSDLLLMDEPFKGLDPETRERVSRFVFDQARGKTVLMVTHDREDLAYADYVLQMEGSPTSRLILEKCGNAKTE
jgi:NitT/TauT family transport system ATP-binding protein